MKPAPSFPECYAAALAESARRCQRLISGCRDPDAGGKVHRLRKETRRLLAGLDLAGNLMPRRRRQRVRRDLKAVLAALGPLRDAQVQRRRLAELAQGHAGHRALIRCLRQRELVASREATAALSKLQPGKTRRKILAVCRGFAGEPQQDLRLRAAVHRAVRQARTQLAARWPRSTDDIAAFHRARVAVKRCRYQLELLESLRARHRPGCLRSLRSYQQRLGDLHDGQLMLIRLEKLAAKGRIDAPLHHCLRRILLRQTARLRRVCLAPPTTSPGRLLPASR